MALDAGYGKLVGQSYTNIRVENKSLGFYGIAEHLHEDVKGLVIYHYAVDRKICRTGPPLPAPFEIFQDCEFIYYGLRLNLIAFLSGKRVKEMVIRDCYNNKSIPVRQNTTICEMFLKHVLKKEQEDLVLQYPMVPAECVEPIQHKLFI